MQDTPLTIAVVGCGRIGAPLAAYLANNDNVKMVYGIDINENQIDTLNAAKAPFHEPGLEPELRKAKEAKKLNFIYATPTLTNKHLDPIDAIILTLGTEVDEYGAPQIMRFIDHAMVYVKRLVPRVVMTRSTVAIGTNRRLESEIIRQGMGMKTTVISAPERIAEGKAFEELPELPQIIGLSALDAKPSMKKFDQIQIAKRLFSNISSNMVVSFEEAELAKLASNAWRYITFAAANEFEMIAREHGLNFRKIRSVMREEYPRNAGIPHPGLAAGPCLRKDSLQLTKRLLPFGLAATAVEVNEFYAVQSAKHILKTLADLPFVQQVVLIGLAFKTGSDDLRDSLSFRIIEELSAAGVRPRVYDPMVEEYASTDFLEMTSTTLFVWLHSPSSPELAALAKKTMSNKNFNLVI